jgi:hypothetical protein
MIQTGAGSNFMFGVRVSDMNQYPINLTQPKRYFDISLIQVVLETGLPIEEIPIALEPCR